MRLRARAGGAHAAQRLHSPPERACTAPRSWFDLVVVLQTDNSVLYDRLQKRRARRAAARFPRRALTPLVPLRSGYKEKKITENIDCEIFGVVLEEAQESYTKEGAVRALRSDSVEDCERNTAELVAWLAERNPAPAADA